MNRFDKPESEPGTTRLPTTFRWFSERCLLRQIEPADAHAIWQAAVHPRFARSWSSAAPASLDEVTTWVRNSRADWMRGWRYTIAAHARGAPDLLGAVEARAHRRSNAWSVEWFLHPHIRDADIETDVILASVDLLFSSAGAERLYVNCPHEHGRFEKLLDEAGFIEVIPAGSLDHVTHRPRTSGLYELRRADWLLMRATRVENGQTDSPAGWRQTAPGLDLSLV